MENKEKTTETVKKTKAAVITDSQLKSAIKSSMAFCNEVKKKVLGNKKAAMPEITEVGGLNKDAIMKIVETLDAMGCNTYETACALRELYQRMK